MLEWLENIKPTVELTTYAGYKKHIKGRLKDYFTRLGITLYDIRAYHIQGFYNELLKSGLKGQTVRRYHANMRKALQSAVKVEIIASNPADRVDLPKSEHYIASYYNKEELETLFKKITGEVIELPILIASYYGLRRSEVLGLKWGAIDFTAKTITIKHTVSEVSVDGEHSIVGKDRGKNKSSYRALPLIPYIENLLLMEKEKQEKYEERFKNTYKDKDGYICVRADGSLIKPGYITIKFCKIIRDNKLRHIRLHDLRHSCASLLLENGVSMKEIQEWLGHSNYSITANTYAHLDKKSKEKSAEIISGIFSKSEQKNVMSDTSELKRLEYRLEQVIFQEKCVKHLKETNA
jgi:integrase